MTSFQFPTEGISYTKAEKKIINYIYQHPSAVIFMSIQQLSEALGISESTISRFSRHAGYEDFKALKHHLQKSLERGCFKPRGQDFPHASHRRGFILQETSAETD